MINLQVIRRASITETHRFNKTVIYTTSFRLGFRQRIFNILLMVHTFASDFFFTIASTANQLNPMSMPYPSSHIPLRDRIPGSRWAYFPPPVVAKCGYMTNF